MKYIKKFEANIHEYELHKLINAINNNDIIEVKQIIDNYPNIIDDKDIHGNTPLNSACYIGNIEIVKFLIENGANINNTNSHMNFSPLSKLCYCRDFSKKHLEIVKYLLSLPNINIEIKNLNDITPLLLALISSKRKYHLTRKDFNKNLVLEMILLLLKKGADIYAKKNDFDGFDILKKNDDYHKGNFIFKSCEFQDIIFKKYGEKPFINKDIPTKYLCQKFSVYKNAEKYNL